MTEVLLARMIVDQPDQENQLQIGYLDFGTATDKATRFGKVARDAAGALLLPFTHRLQKMQRARQR